MPSINILEDPTAYENAINEKSILIVIHIYSNSDRKGGPLDAGLERASNDYANVKFYRLDKDQVPDIGKDVDIYGTPMLAFFKDGAKIDDLIGENLDEIRSAIEHHSGSTRW